MNKPKPGHLPRFEEQEPPVLLIPLYDEHRGNNPPVLIGWFSAATGLILTAKFNISMTGTKIAAMRMRAVDKFIEGVKSRVAQASAESEGDSSPEDG